MLTIPEIKQFIEEDRVSDKKRLASVGQRYYESEHDIMNYRLFYYNADGKLVEDKTRSNIKISHPFFMILAEQLSSYMLSFGQNPIRAVETAEGLQKHLDTYFDDDFWAEIGELIIGTYVKGFDYIYGYQNDEDRLAFKCADSMGVVEVQEKYSSDKKPHKIWHYVDTDLTEKGKRTVVKIEVWSEEGIYFYVQDSESNEIKVDDSVGINPRPHVVYTNKKTGKKTGKLFKFIPFWRLDNNKKQFSGLKPIKDQIDDYDRHACSLSNNLTDFDTPLYLVKGFEGDNLDELQQNLKTKKMMGVDSDGGIDIETIEIPYEARKAKLDIDKENIFMFGMGFNPTQVGDGNITNVVIKSRYTLLDLKADKLEVRLRALLKQLIKPVLDEINTKNKLSYKPSDIYFEFGRAVMTNETENIQNAKTEAETKQVEINTLLALISHLDNKTIVQNICDALDIDYDKIKDKLPDPDESMNSIIDAGGVLGGGVVE